MTKKRKQVKEINDLEWIEEDPMSRIGHGTDIYDPKQREEMLEDDEITAVEATFMEGRERALKKKEEDLWLEKRETTSVELVQKEYQED